MGGANAGGFTCPMAASGWTTAAGWMKLPDASRAAARESPAGHTVGSRMRKRSDASGGQRLMRSVEIGGRSKGAREKARTCMEKARGGSLEPRREREVPAHGAGGGGGGHG